MEGIAFLLLFAHNNKLHPLTGWLRFGTSKKENLRRNPLIIHHQSNCTPSVIQIQNRKEIWQVMIVIIRCNLSAQSKCYFSNGFSS